MRMSRSVAAIVGGVALVVALTRCSTTPTPPPAPGAYVHLGDSYAAGTGIAPLVADSDLQCLRSQRNFGELVAAQRRSQFSKFIDVSCAGAATKDLAAEQYPGIAPQSQAVDANTALVTLMIGGNDGGIFSSALSTCSSAAVDDQAGDPCRRRHGTEFTNVVAERTFPALVSGLRDLRSRAPKARILVVGYPWILPSTGGCYPTMRVATGDVGYLHDLERTLDDALRRASAQTGVTYVDLSTPGHDACAPPQIRWIEPQQGNTTTVPVHPNERGQQALAAAVLRALAT